MNHCIIIKFLPKIMQTQKDTLFSSITELFSKSLSLPGIYKVKVYKNCIFQSNRADLMIKMEMEKEALKNFDSSNIHNQWKSEYGKLLETKTIFDYED